MEVPLNRYLLETFALALEREYIQPYYQPVIRTITGEVCGFEALARWIDPERGVIQPGQFIALLEEHRLIQRLDVHIIRQVCARIRRSMDRGERFVPISVNLSRLDFEMCDIFRTVEELAAEYRIPRNCLHIEITESLFANMPQRIHQVVDRFRRAGYQVWMDDFGSGFSSLNMLKDYTFDELKVDMGFVSVMNLQSRKVLTSVIDMAKNMGLHTLVEGVETRDLYDFLRDIGCEKVQGYLFGRPQPYEAVLEHLERQGICLEKPTLREYYDRIGSINVISSSPFMSMKERNSLASALELNSIPLALLEMRDYQFQLLYHNRAIDEALRGLTWNQDSVSEALAGRRLPADRLPQRIHVLVDEAREQGEAEVHFISGGEYYEIQGKLVSEGPDQFCLLMRLQNLSHNQDYQRISTLDAEMRHIYAIFDTIALIDLQENLYQLLFMGPNDAAAPSTDVREVVQAYADARVFPEDRERFLAFYDLATMENRILSSGMHHLVDYFRANNQFSEYAWTQYVLVSCRPGFVLSLIRWADADITVLREHLERLYADESPAALSDGRLWKSLIQTDVTRLYWKDRERRFQGASQGFLRFLGLEDPRELLGKTDEELGWHIRVEHAVNSDLRTIRFGEVVRDKPLRFLVDGVNRKTLNSTAPVYNEYGAIIGMVGSIRSFDPGEDRDQPVPDLDRIDGLTGLLNTRGLAEELAVYCDMYYLRSADFVRIHISIEDYDSRVLQYGKTGGENLIRSFGRALGRFYGKSAVLGRSRGHHFVILRQYETPEDIPRIIAELRRFAASLGTEDGIPGGLYITLGHCVFSESLDIYRQEQTAEQRLEEDHGSHIAAVTRRDHAGTFFGMYDKLPLAFAVYEMKTDPDTGEVDAVFFYVNARFAMEQQKTPEELIGRSLHEIFPNLEKTWYDIACAAAYLSRETVVDRIYFDCMKTHYHLTASQIFRPGYCVFTYQPLDGPFAALGTEQTEQ